MNKSKYLNITKAIIKLEEAEIEYKAKDINGNYIIENEEMKTLKKIVILDLESTTKISDIINEQIIKNGYKL